jgi:predicted acetyltransferase
LRSILPRGQQLGLDRVPVTCHDGNAASARTIEKAGGVLEEIRQTELGLTRRYWIPL